MIEKFMDFLLDLEGFYSYVPQDYGGETVWGISRRFNPDWEGWKIVDKSDIKKEKERLKKLAKDFYYKKYLSPFLFMQKTHPKSMLFMFDWYVNAGVNAIRRLQRVVKEREDGIIGPRTREAVLRMKDDNLLWLLFWERQLFYSDIVRNDRSQLVFLAGWTNRNFKVYEFVNRL